MQPARAQLGADPIVHQHLHAVRDGLLKALRDVLMQPIRIESRVHAVPRRRLGRCRPIRMPFGELHTHSCLHRHQFSPRHPQVGQREQRVQLRGVLLQPSVAHFHMPELALDHPKGMLDLGTDAGFEAFELSGQFFDQPALVQLLALAWAHGDVPAHTGLGVGPLADTLMTGIAPGFGFLSMQQRIAFEHVVDTASGAANRVHQARFGIHADMGLHAEEPLLAF